MSAYGTQPTLRPAGNPFEPDRRDWLRLFGGVLFAAGAIVLAARKSDWGAGAYFFTFLIPCALLYALGFAGRRAWPGLQGWQSAFFAFGILLLPLVLVEFVDAIGGTPGAK